MNLVWFKRDLRCVDHEPLARASAGPVLPLYVIEPEYWLLADTSERQYRFLLDSLRDLAEQLARRGQPLWVCVGDAVSVIQDLVERFDVDAVFSHEETGNGWTFARDRRVGAMLRGRAVAWHQYRQHGIVRGLGQRVNWASQWEALMAAAQWPVADLRGPGAGPFQLPDDLPMSERTPCRVQRGGSAAGTRALDSFLAERGRDYTRAMSSPLSAGRACSRLSPHLALGTLSLRATVTRLRSTEADDASWARSYRSLDKRLHWHCHFMQKLESEPRMEFEPIHRGFIGLKTEPADPVTLQRWIDGETGWPFVDACMRSLAATGWMNFRMRAMIVAINAYHLWQPWQGAAQRLAQRFVDYEPGIHYSQIQMQSGTTGINVNRMYNPIKQSRDQDPDGDFIRRWVPELAGYNSSWIHEPWKAPANLQRAGGARIGEHYPEPIADPVQSARVARDKMRDYIRTHDLDAEARRVLAAHGSRMKQPRPRSSPRTSTAAQNALDFGD
ncbi:FAD-binding domain-containing protein [Litorivicinus lipolyticus]|uniref:FAD-binding domain-containing protein n=1 Tax=Litorivicinus lipolyticus TaxID=418701 RepID=UPI003B593CDD